MFKNFLDLSKLGTKTFHSFIGNFIKQQGAAKVTSNVAKLKPGEKSKMADGIDMGYQMEPGVIPIVYGLVGMSSTQFDTGQKPSEEDASFTVQGIKMPISEGPIQGLTYPTAVPNGPRDYSAAYYGTYEIGDTPNNFKQVLVNDKLVMEDNGVINFRDMKCEMTRGDGGGVYQSGTIGSTNPLTNQEIEAYDDSTKTDLLNDLGDVSAGKGNNHVLYWNPETDQWEAKSFNELLNEAGATYDGGAGGTGGTGGSGGSGGTGGTGGVGASDGSGLKYTQWNPPPHTFRVYGGESVSESTVTPAPTKDPQVEPGRGAPLRRLDQTTPYFSETFSFAKLDEAVDAINITTHFPDGIYKEVTTVTTVKNGTIASCGTTRPITDSGNLDCLDPDVEIAPDGKSATTRERFHGEVTVYVVLTTTKCGREFILHEGNYDINAGLLGGYKHTKTFSLDELNAGSGAIVTGENAGTQQIGALLEPADCNATEVEHYDFKNWTLNDYLNAYPNQVLKATDSVKVYAWIQNKETSGDEEFRISTPTYLYSVDICKPFTDFDEKYNTAESNTNDNHLYPPNHYYRWRGYKHDNDDIHRTLGAARCYDNVNNGTFSDTSNPQPLLVWDYTSQGQPGGAGTDGTTGTGGSTGSAGTSGTVTVPALDPIPTVEMRQDGTYLGTGVSQTKYLPEIDVFHANNADMLTLVTAVSSGSVDIVTLSPNVAATGRASGTMTLTGTKDDLNTTLDGGVRYTSTTATSGDVNIDFNISSASESSVHKRLIRSQAATEYKAPQFIIMGSVTWDGETTRDWQLVVPNTSNATGPSDYHSLVARTTFTLSVEDTIEKQMAKVADAINNYSGTPNWTAELTANGNGSYVTVTGPEALGSSLNGIQPFDLVQYLFDNTGTEPYAGPRFTIEPIREGVKPNRTTQPTPNTNNIKGNFIRSGTYTNTLDSTEVAWFGLTYRPKQKDGEIDLDEVGVMVGGRIQMEEPSTDGISFDSWKAMGYSGGYVTYGDVGGWSANPAWVFFDYLTNTRYGLGNEVKILDDQKERLYRDIYCAAEWCYSTPGADPDMFFRSFNGVFYGAESKMEALQMIADTFHAKFVYINGNPRLLFDGAAYQTGDCAPVIKKLVNQANSANTMYASGSIDNVHNVINVKFNDAENFWRVNEIQYRNEDSIALLGERETTVEAFACSFKQQALWHAAWMFETEASNSEIVTYTAGWDHFDVEPGDMIILNDTLRPDVQTNGGRVIGVNNTTLTLDRSASGSIAVTGDDGVIYYGTASGTTATMAGGSYVNGAIWNEYTGVAQPTHKVIAIEETETGLFNVTAHIHDPAKYTRIFSNTA